MSVPEKLGCYQNGEQDKSNTTSNLKKQTNKKLTCGGNSQESEQLCQNAPGGVPMKVPTLQTTHLKEAPDPLHRLSEGRLRMRLAAVLESRCKRS